MKLPFKPLCIVLAFLGATATGARAALLTFEDVGRAVSPYDGSPIVPNGYGGLQWLGFGLLAGAQYPASGYYSGMVSPMNVAFNFDQFDRRAYISSSTPFNFDSAYLTAAFSAGFQVEVQGFVGTLMTYDQTYTVNRSGPVICNFDFIGINGVRFIPLVSDIFVMDNVTINVVPEPSTNALILVAAALGGFAVQRKQIKLRAGR
jgi:hypothetical protein